MSDGGSAFWAWHGISRFTRLLDEMGIDQIIAKVSQHNGKVEVLNANVQKELFNQERFFDPWGWGNLGSSARMGVVLQPAPHASCAWRTALDMPGRFSHTSKSAEIR